MSGTSNGTSGGRKRIGVVALTAALSLSTLGMWPQAAVAEPPAAPVAAVHDANANADDGPDPSVGTITVHKESIGEDVDQPFGFTVSPAAGSVSSFSLDDQTSIAANVSPQDLAISSDAAESTLWAVGPSGGACGAADGCIYFRSAGVSTWTQLPTSVAGVRISGTTASSEAYFVNSAGTAFFWNGTAAVSLGSPAGCVVDDITSNGATLIVSCDTSGDLYEYTGDFAGTNTYTQLTGAFPITGDDISLSETNVLLQDNGGTVLFADTIDPTNATVTSVASLSGPNGDDIQDVAVSPDGSTLYAVTNDQDNGGAFEYAGGGNWVLDDETRGAARATTANDGRAWVIDNRGQFATTALGATIFSRNADNSWYDDERVKTSSVGNTVDLPVTAGTYTITENSAPNWANQAVDCVTANGDTASTSVTNSGGVAGSATITIGAGDHVTCTYQNVDVASPTTASANCSAPFLNTFGDGTAGGATPLPSGETSYHYNPDAGVATNDGFYTVVTNGADVGDFVSPTFFDHTSGDGTGNFLAINASYDPGIFFEQQFTNVVVGTHYTFSAWLANLDVASLPIPVNVTFNVVDPSTGAILGTYSTGDVTSTDWAQYGFSFVAPTTKFDLELVNNSTGGNGNDLGIDDIGFGLSCAPVTLTKALAGPRVQPGDQFTVAIHTGSATGPVVNDTTDSTTTGSGHTVDTNTGTTDNPASATPDDPNGAYEGAVGVPLFLTETYDGTATPTYYPNATITCTDANQATDGQSGLPTNAAFTGSLEIIPVAGASISCTLTNIPDPPAISIVKSTNTTSISSVGQTVPYSFLVTNNGTVTLTDVSVADFPGATATGSPLTTPVCATPDTAGDPLGTLSAGASETCTSTYTVTQADLNAGSVTDTAVATGTPPVTVADPNPTPVTSLPSTVTIPGAGGSAATSGGGLAFTGVANLPWALGAGIALLFAGLALLIGFRSRRRRVRRASE